MSPHSLHSSDLVRTFNTVRVQRMIWASNGISRAQLARDCGLSRSTVTLVVNELSELGLVQESHLAASSGGRPPIVLKWVEDSHQLIGIDIGSSHVTALIANMSGTVVRSEHIELNVNDNPQKTISYINAIISDFIAGANVAVLGIGIALPCPVPTNGSGTLNNNIMPKWSGIRLQSLLEKEHGIPVFIDNDANLGALAELWWGKCKMVSDFAFVKLDTGVGAGIFTNGQLLRGKDGLSGEIGHIAISRTGPKCRCGQLGCLEAWIGKESLERSALYLQRPNTIDVQTQRPSINDLMTAYINDDAHAKTTLNHAIGQLAQALAPFIMTLNPEKIVLWGPLTQLNTALTTSLKNTLQDLCSWQNLSQTEITISQLGDEAMALGAFTMALDNALQQPKLSLEQVRIAQA